MAAATLFSLTACGGTNAPTPVPVPVPPTPDPPTITCPTPQTVQSIDGGAAAVTFTQPTVANGKAPVNVVCTPAPGSSFVIGQKTVTCTATDSLERTAPCSFPVTVLEPPRLTTTSFLAFGDSITAGEDGQNSTAPSATLMAAQLHPYLLFPQPQRYPQKLQDMLAQRYRTQSPTVSNRGSAGEMAEDRAAQSRVSSLASSRQYSVAWSMEAPTALSCRGAGAAPGASEGFRKIIREARTRVIRPYVAPVPPMNPA